MSLKDRTAPGWISVQGLATLACSSGRSGLAGPCPRHAAGRTRSHRTRCTRGGRGWLGREGATAAAARAPMGDGECAGHGSQQRDPPRWCHGGEAAEFEECGGVPAVVALRSSSAVSGGVLQIVEIKGSDIGP
jgi:hypothetical protein